MAKRGVLGRELLGKAILTMGSSLGGAFHLLAGKKLGKEVTTQQLLQFILQGTGCGAAGSGMERCHVVQLAHTSAMQ